VKNEKSKTREKRNWEKTENQKDPNDGDDNIKNLGDKIEIEYQES
jgi:hypothetical protein